MSSARSVTPLDPGRSVVEQLRERMVAMEGQAARQPVATLPGMWERTLTISSAGKTFSTTGWKVGWVTGPAEAVAAVRAVKQFLTYVASGPFQPAVATALDLPDAVYAALSGSLERKRDLLVSGLQAAGLPVSVPSGTYFVVADAAALGARDGLAFCRDLPALCGVVGVPVSVFHDDVEAARTLVADSAVDTNAAPGTGGEDFAFMLEQRPGAYIVTGNGDSAEVHHPRYDFNDDAIPHGAGVLAAVVEAKLPRVA